MTFDRRTLLAGLTSLAGAYPFLSASALHAAQSEEWARFARLPGVKLTGHEEIGMLLFPEFTALDVVGPYHFFAGMMGAKVHLVTNQHTLDPVQSDMGLAITPSCGVDSCPRDLTVLFIPGGTDGVLAAASDPQTISFIRDRALRAQYTTSVCTGSLILGVAGLLNRKRATSHWSVLQTLSQFGAIPVNRRVVKDGRLITGAGVSAGLDLGLSIVAELRGRQYAAASMLTAEYAPEPPFEGGSITNTNTDVTNAMSSMFSRFLGRAQTLRPLHGEQ